MDDEENNSQQLEETNPTIEIEPENKESLEWIRWKLTALETQILNLTGILSELEMRSADSLKEMQESLRTEMQEVLTTIQEVKTLEESAQRENQLEASPLATPAATVTPGGGDSAPMEPHVQNPDERPQAVEPQAPEPLPEPHKQNQRKIIRV